jgi:hypothetical protein
MTITVTSDEGLSSAPTVGVFAHGGALEQTPTVLTTAANTWTATFDGTTPAAGDKDVVVLARDAAMSNSPASATFNEVIVNGTSTVNPVVDFALIVPTAKSFKLDTVDVTAQLVPSADKKNFFLVPATELTLGLHTVAVAAGKATDAAGNTNTAISFTFTVAARTDFSVGIVAGWQAVSFPSNPVVSSIDTVFSNAGIVQVVAYNATNAANPWQIATKDAVSGKFSSTTQTPLNTITAGPGYWVQANNFEAQKVALVGEVEPGAGSPPPISSIPVAAGWNFIGVIDPSRIQTQAHFGAGLLRGATPVTSSDYFFGVSETRVYRYNPTTLTFVEVTAGTQLTVGDGLWVNIVPNVDGSVPAITP